MSLLHRILSDDEATCTVSECIDEWKKDLGVCSSFCIDACPSLCKAVVYVVPRQSPATVIEHDYSFKKILIISVSSIITSLFLLSLLVLCYKYYNRRRRLIAITRRWSMDEEARNWDFDGPSQPVIIDHPIWHIRTIGLNPTVISSIKVCKYSKNDGLVEGTDCSVCLSEFEEEETLRLLPKCKHAFHLSCIDTWLRSHTNCPLCRAPIVVGNNAVSDESEGLNEIRVMIPEENGEIDEEIERAHEEESDGFVNNIRRDGEVDESQQRVRRSVSLNSLSGLRVSTESRGKEKVKRCNIGSSIVGRSSFLKRSISYSGK